MRLLKRKVEEEDFDEEVSRVVKIKDLKKENRKKRGEPSKPWGKKERYLVGLIFGFTVVTSVVLAFATRHGKLPGLPRITVPNLGLSETVVIENKTPTPVQKKNSDQIIENIKTLTQSLSGIYAVSVIDLRTGVNFGVNQDEVMEAASLIKLPVMATAYVEYEKGRFAMDSKYTLRNADKVGGSGSIYYKDPGETFTYRELISYMGQQSDNTAFNVVRKKLTDTVINAFMEKNGMENTSLDENTTTPYEIARLLQKIYDGGLFPQKDSDEVFKYLTKTIYEDFLPKGVPSNIPVAHKYGRLVHVINDGGVVYAQKPYVVVIMTSGVVESEAEVIIPKLSRIVFDGMEN